MRFASPVLLVLLGGLSSCGDAPPGPLQIDAELAQDPAYWLERIDANSGRPFHAIFEVELHRSWNAGEVETRVFRGETWFQDAAQFRVITETKMPGNPGFYLNQVQVHCSTGLWLTSALVDSAGLQPEPPFVHRWNPVSDSSALNAQGLTLVESGGVDLCAQIAALNGTGEWTVESFDGRNARLVLRAAEGDTLRLSPVLAARDEAGMVLPRATELRVKVSGESGFPVGVSVAAADGPERYEVRWSLVTFPEAHFAGVFEFAMPDPVQEFFDYGDSAAD